MKKDKHILINLTDEEFNELSEEAEKQQRTISSLARLWIVKAIILNSCKNYRNKTGVNTDYDIERIL